MTLTTDPTDSRLGHGANDAPVPQNKAYLVLSEEERAKGFVRPVRLSYIHVGGQGPKHPLRDLTADELKKYTDYGYVKYELYPESDRPRLGRFWTQADLDAVGRGCKASTKMDRAIAETYARFPKFYGNTYCVRCCMHRAVSEFVWEDDGSVVGS